MSTKTISAADAAKANERASVAAKVWRYDGLFTNTTEATKYVNLPPAQLAGEAILSVRDDGAVHVFLFR